MPQSHPDPSRQNSGHRHLIVISAPSGAGKTTLCQKLLEDFPSLILSISSTTRAPRGAEKHGVEYFFLSQQEFEEKIKKELFAEWAKVHGNYYGTSKEWIEKAFAEGKSVLLDIDVQGAELLHQAYPQECFRIFISPPNLEVLESRLRARKTDSEENIKRRMENAREEMEQMKKFDAVIVNQALEQAYDELKKLVSKVLGSSNQGGPTIKKNKK